MSEIDPKKMKVTELRDELKNRGLDFKGKKDVLVKRLREALGVAVGGDDSVLDDSQMEADSSQLETTVDESIQEGEGDAETAGKEVEAEPAVEELPKEEPVEQAEEAVEDTDEPMKEAEAEPAAKEEGAQNGDDDTSAAAQETPAGEATEEQEGDKSKEEEIIPQDLEGEGFIVKDEIGEDDTRGEKRKRSRSPRDKRHKRSRSRSPMRRPATPPLPEMDSETWLETTDVIIDRYHCDLNLDVTSDCSAEPFCSQGFGYMWAGMRATYGVQKGKVAFELKITKDLDVAHLGKDEKVKNACRVGWAVGGLQLGEDKQSWGYGGTAKKSSACKFEDFGEKFGVGDVITSYLDLDSDPVMISFSKNGKDQGVAYEVDKDALPEGTTLYPAVLTKNQTFSINFGQLEEPAFALKEGYGFIGALPVEDRVRGDLPAKEKSDCEVLMMVGLPAAGKSYWAAKQEKEVSEKYYNVLGTNNIIDKMKVQGLPRKNNYSGRWEVLFDMANKCLHRFLSLAGRKKRNYIIDQTNVYSTAQKKKMRWFAGFNRKAIVILPTEEEFKHRTEKRLKEEGKDVPKDAVLEMKANMSLPTVGDHFDEIVFTEQDGDAAKTLVEQYVKEGRAKFPSGSRDRYRSRDDKRDLRHYNQRQGGFNRNDSRDNRRYGNSGGGYQDRRNWGNDRNYYDRNRSQGGSSGGRYGTGGSSGNYGGYRGGSGGYGGYNRGQSDNYRQGSGGYSSGGSRGWGSGGGQGTWGGAGYGGGNYGQSGSGSYGNWSGQYGQQYGQPYGGSGSTGGQWGSWGQHGSGGSGSGSGQYPHSYGNQWSGGNWSYK